MAGISWAPSRTTLNRDLQAGLSPEELQRLFDLSLQMLCVARIDGYFKCVNPAFETTLGYPREELLSRPFMEFVHPDDREATQVEIEKLSEGIPTVSFENRYRCRDGSYRWLLWTSSPAVDGNLLFAAAMDVTDRKAAETETKASLHTQRAVSAILRVCLEPASLEDQLHRCLEVLSSVSEIAPIASGSILLVEEDPDTLVLKAHFGLPSQLQDLCRKVVLGQCLCGRAGATRQIQFADCVDACREMRCDSIPDHGHYCVPMVLDRELLGVLNLYVKPGHERIPQEEQFFYSVADVLAGTVKRKRTEAVLRRREAELVAVRRIQEHLLPDASPTIPGFDIAGASQPADFAGGDYFDYLTLPDGSLGVVIADVTGHGIAAALLAASTHALVRSLANRNLQIQEILSLANSVLLEETADDRFVALLLGRLDPLTRTFAYASAGQQTGFLLGHSGQVKVRLESTAFPLAILPDTVFPTSDPIPLESGEVLILPSDGFLEALSREGIPFGVERMLEVVRDNRQRAASDIIECLFQEVRRFVQPRSAPDDLTSVIIRVESES